MRVASNEYPKSVARTQPKAKKKDVGGLGWRGKLWKGDQEKDGSQGYADSSSIGKSC